MLGIGVEVMPEPPSVTTRSSFLMNPPSCSTPATSRSARCSASGKLRMPFRSRLRSSGSPAFWIALAPTCTSPENLSNCGRLGMKRMVPASAPEPYSVPWAAQHFDSVDVVIGIGK